MANPSLVTAPTTLPVTMDEVKSHLGIEVDDVEALSELDLFTRAATNTAEVFLQRGLVTQTWSYTLDDFPGHGALPAKDYIELPGGRLVSITSLTYTDSDNTATVWGSANYFASTTHEPGRLHLAYGISWPSVTLKPADAIVVEYIVGYGTGDQIPYSIRAGILLIIGELWENRENSVLQVGLANAVVVPRSAENLMGPYRLYNV